MPLARSLQGVYVDGSTPIVRTPTEQDLHVPAGSDADVFLTVINSAGAAVSLTGCALTLTVRSDVGVNPPLIARNAVITGDGTATFALSTNDTVNLAPAAYVYDVLLTLSDGEHAQIVPESTFYVDAAITDPGETPTIPLPSVQGQAGKILGTDGTNLEWVAQANNPISPKGAWSSATAYSVLDLVTDAGSSYVCTAQVGPSITHPASDPTHWQLSASKGDTGATGPVGPTGPQGPAGASFTPEGAWSALTAYTALQVVTFAGSSYVCTANVGPTATTPAADSAHWQVNAQGSSPQEPQVITGSGTMDITNPVCFVIATGANTLVLPDGPTGGYEIRIAGAGGFTGGHSVAISGNFLSAAPTVVADEQEFTLVWLAASPGPGWSRLSSAVESLAGDLSGVTSSATVSKLQGGTLTITTPSDGQVLVRSGGVWVNGSLPASGVTPGTYTRATVSVNAEGRVTAASSGTAPSTLVPFSGTYDLSTAAPRYYDNGTSAGAASAKRYPLPVGATRALRIYVTANTATGDTKFKMTNVDTATSVQLLVGAGVTGLASTTTPLGFTDGQTLALTAEPSTIGTGAVEFYATVEYVPA